MLRSMTCRQLREWECFSELEPSNEERADYRSAQVVQALWNIARDAKRHPKGFALTDFLLCFGDALPAPVSIEPQSVSYQEMLIDSWIAGHHALMAEAKVNGH